VQRKLLPGLLAAVIMALGAATVHTAEPVSGAVSTQQDVTWTGRTFLFSNPLACLGGFDLTCDRFALTVDAEQGTPVTVAIATTSEGDDYDLFIFYPNGTLAAKSTAGGGSEAATFEHRTDRGTGPYKVRVQPFLVTPGSSYTGVATIGRGPFDVARECLEPIPDTIGAIETGQAIELSTLVLLDGITLDRGETVMAKAAESYAPLSVVLTASFREVSFVGDEAEGLIQQAKDLFGGIRPADADLVYVLTNKDIQSGGNTGVAGLADCIGGVRFPERAFAVGENIAENGMLGPFVHTINGTAVVAAHELGHLMGGHHHYANCAEGLQLDELLNFELTPCTLMFNAVNTASLNFSTINAAVARGHAVKYAAP
jgi:hypothetical protein